MTPLREELEALVDATWPHGGPRYGRTELAIAVANHVLEVAARECEKMGPRNYPITGALYDGNCAAAIRAMRVG